MSFLSYLIPAVREIRAPLAGGYLWLLAAWLALAARVPDRAAVEEGSIWEDLLRIEDAIGTGGVVVALSTAAYLVGSLLSEPVSAIFRQKFFDGDRLEALGQSVPESRFLVDAALRVGSEAEFRFHVAAPLLAVAIVIIERSGAIGLALLFVALLVAGHGLLLGLRAERRTFYVMDFIEDRRTQLSDEERRTAQAHVRARVSKQGRNLKLVLENAGPSIARDVEVIGDDGKHLRFVPESLLPVAEIEPSDSVELPLAVAMGDPIEATVVVRWVDGTGPQERQQAIRLL